MNRALIPAIALIALLLPFSGFAAPGDDQKPVVQKPDTKRDRASKQNAPCCSGKQDPKGTASGMPRDMQGMHQGGHDHGAMHGDAGHETMHEQMHGEGASHGGHGHGM